MGNKIYWVSVDTKGKPREFIGDPYGSVYIKLEKRKKDACFWGDDARKVRIVEEK